MKNLLHLLFICLTLQSCNSCSIKEKLNKGGQAVGEGVGEFTHGVTTGVDKSLQVNITPSNDLKNKGIKIGKVTVSSDSGANDNLLNVYTIFDNDFKGTVRLKVYDNRGLEMGRCDLELLGKKGEAKFYDYKFDKRTNIDKDSKVTMEGV